MLGSSNANITRDLHTKLNIKILQHLLDVETNQSFKNFTAQVGMFKNRFQTDSYPLNHH